MALALLPPYESNRSLQPPLPSPTFLLASAAMEQAHKVRPSLPSISSLIEAVTEQSEKGLFWTGTPIDLSDADKPQELTPLQHSILCDGYREGRMDME